MSQAADKCWLEMGVEVDVLDMPRAEQLQMLTQLFEHYDALSTFNITRLQLIKFIE